MNGSKAYGPAGIGHAIRRRHSCCAVQWFLSPHPSPLPWGEGEPNSPQSTIQSHWLSAARCALFPLPEGEGQGEGKRPGHPPAPQTIPGTVELGESCGRAAGFP